MRNTTQAWYQSRQVTTASRLFQEQLEIPDWAVLYHPDCYVSVTHIHDSKALDNHVMHGERSLMFDEAKFIKQRIAENDKINIIDIGETSGVTTLPLIYEMTVEDSVLGTYIPATVNQKVNEVAVNNLRNYFLQSRIFDPNKTKFKTSSIARNFNLENAKDLMADVNAEYQGQRFCNLFLLLNSSLGNSERPEDMLRNIYNTMSDQDFLVIIQGIYRRSSESLILDDYYKWINDPAGWFVMRDISRKFMDEPSFKVRWNEQKDGIQVYLESQKHAEAFGATVEEGDDITLFRSARFEDDYLKELYERVGFRILNISYDDNMDNAMYFLKK